MWLWIHPPQNPDPEALKWNYIDQLHTRMIRKYWYYVINWIIWDSRFGIQNFGNFRFFFSFSNRNISVGRTLIRKERLCSLTSFSFLRSKSLLEPTVKIILFFMSWNLRLRNSILPRKSFKFSITSTVHKAMSQISWGRNYQNF